jgi:addiction module HigA family antidote
MFTSFACPSDDILIVDKFPDLDQMVPFMIPCGKRVTDECGTNQVGTVCMRQAMLMTKRKPATIGEILVEEFMKPIGLTQGALADAMGVQRKHVNELCNDRRNVTAATALILARVFGNSPDFWLNVQRRSDLWEAMHSPRERKRIERARPLTEAA